MNHCPGCKQTFTNTRKLAKHKRECEALEQHVYKEIKRLSNELGMAVSTRQYNRLADQSLPRSVWLIHAYGDWNEILQQAGQRPQVCVCGVDVYYPRCGVCAACYKRKSESLKAKILCYN